MALRPGCGRWLPALPRATPQRQDNLGVTWPQDRFAAWCLPDAPDAPAKPVHFWGASWRGDFRKQPAEPAGLAETPGSAVKGPVIFCLGSVVVRDEVVPS